MIRLFEVCQDSQFGWLPRTGQLNWWQALEASERLALNGYPTRIDEVAEDGRFIRTVSGLEICLERLERP